ncbi:EthD family reductase [Pasteuria penetrans]|uniref:EthD family reductase n=1 Tax=Pasteuria penetrans TaxID=86005 RepID=UPI000F98AF96|nr:EthD family reductase [Pasteuria penetrans]
MEKMVKLMVLHHSPDDLEEFDQHYFGTFLPSVHNVPGVVGGEVMKFRAMPKGDPPPYHSQLMILFPDEGTLQKSLLSAEWATVIENLETRVPAVFTLFLGELVW